MLVLLEVFLVEGEAHSVEFLTPLRGRNPCDHVRAGAALHVVYGGIAGATCPQIMWLAGLNGSHWAGLPGALLVSLGFGGGLFVLALAYRWLRFYQMERTGTQLGMFLVLHLAYVVVFGWASGC